MSKWRHRLYGTLQFLWLPASLGILVGGAYLLFSGYATPLIPPPSIPKPYLPPIILVLWAVAGIAGWRRFSSLQARARQTLWSEANLYPNGEDESQGTVRGRSVRVRTGTWKEPRRDRNSSATIVEAEMTRPVDEGAVVDFAPSQKVRSLAETSPTFVFEEGDELAVVGESEACVQALLSGRAREALLELDTIGKLRVGKSSNLIADPVGNALESLFGEDAAESGLGGDASTVTHQLKGLILDPDKLKRQVDAAAVIANAFERAAAESADT